MSLEMYDEARTFSKLFLGAMQAKRCGDSQLDTAQGPGRPQPARPLSLYLYGIKAGDRQHVNSPGSCSHSAFHPQHGLEGFASLPKVFTLSSLEKEMQCLAVTLSQRGHGPANPPDGVFLTPDCLHFTP